jgi:hypothetical protein
MSDSPDDIPDFATLAADPEIAALLDFEPVPRKIEVEGGWTPELQREFIARLAVHGSANKACEEMGKNRTGMNKLYNNPQGASFRAAWRGAVALAKRRKAVAADFISPGTKPPTLDHRRKLLSSVAHRALPGQVPNEFGEWEDEDSLHRRAEDARDSISNKLLGARRLYLQSICDHPAKRAAFEILTDLPVDWDKAQRLEPQPDEPWRQVNMREPDMLMTAENGWMGDLTRGGADKKAELRKIIDEYWAQLGRPPIDWDAE